MGYVSTIIFQNSLIMTAEVKAKLEKVYQLIVRGTTEGEIQSAKLAYDRIVKKYNLSEKEANYIKNDIRLFKYSTTHDKLVLYYICKLILGYDRFNNEVNVYRTHTEDGRHLRIKLDYYEYIQIDSCYEYFRRHYTEQYKMNVKPLLKAKKLELDNHPYYVRYKSKSKKVYSDFKKTVDDVFLRRYFEASNLITDEEIENSNKNNKFRTVDYNTYTLANNINFQNGVYNVQINGGNLQEKN